MFKSVIQQFFQYALFFLMFSGQVWAAEPELSHNIVVHPLSGLPSAITLAVKNFKVSKARVFLVVDGELLVLNLEHFNVADVFHANFPSPKNTLSYQFQLVDFDGKVFMSDNFKAKLQCKTNEVEKLFKNSSVSDWQEKLLREAVELEHQRLMLEQLIDSINDFAKSGGA